MLHAIQQQIKLIVETETLLQDVSQNDLLSIKLKRIDLLAVEKEKELNKNYAYQMRLHEALSDGLLDISEYNTMWSQYSKRVADANAALAELKEQRAGLEDGADLDRAWIGQFLKYRNITELSRETVITLIDKIFVHEDKRLHLNFNFHDELADFIALTKNALKEVG